MERQVIPVWQMHAVSVPAWLTSINFLHKWLPENGSLNHRLGGETQSGCLFPGSDQNSGFLGKTIKKCLPVWDVCYLVTASERNPYVHPILRTSTVLPIDNEKNDYIKGIELNWVDWEIDWERVKWGSHQAHSHNFIGWIPWIPPRKKKIEDFVEILLNVIFMYSVPLVYCGGYTFQK